VDRFKLLLKIGGAFGLLPPAGVVTMEAVNQGSLHALAMAFAPAVWTVFFIVYGIVALAVAGTVVLVLHERRYVPLIPRRPVDARLSAPVRQPELVKRPLAIEAPKARVDAASEMLAAVHDITEREEVVPAR
jgi:hypothetical protein